MNHDAQTPADEGNAARQTADTPSAEPTEAMASQSNPRAPGQASNAEVGQLEDQLDQARAKAQTYLDLAQRTQADFVNYKRRVEQERRDYARSAKADVLLRILPTLDDLQRAVNSLPPALASSDWAQGVVLIDRKFKAEVDGLGLKRLEVVGKPFDPWEEEAVMHEPSDEYPTGTVTHEVRAGYSLDGKVIRPAQVVVSSGPPEPGS